MWKTCAREHRYTQTTVVIHISFKGVPLKCCVICVVLFEVSSIFVIAWVLMGAVQSCGHVLCRMCLFLFYHSFLILWIFWRSVRLLKGQRWLKLSNVPVQNTGRKPAGRCLFTLRSSVHLRVHTHTHLHTHTHTHAWPLAESCVVSFQVTNFKSTETHAHFFLFLYPLATLFSAISLPPSLRPPPAASLTCLPVLFLPSHDTRLNQNKLLSPISSNHFQADKTRNPYFCNCKLFLTFLPVL